MQNYSDGPASFVRNPGTALSEAYSDYFFLTQFPGKLITAFQLRPSGAAFEMTGEHVFHEGFMATGMSFGPSGDLFVADWAGDWTPTEDGGIVRIDVEETARNPLRARTEQLIREGMADRTVEELVGLLAYSDQRVRLDAQFELVSRNESGSLVRTAFDKSAAQLQRIHSLWGMSQLARKRSLDMDHPVAPLLADADPQVQIQTLRLIKENPSLFPQVEANLMELLQAPDPQVQFHAAMALGAAGTPRAVPALIDLLAANDDGDAFLRHAAVSGLAGIGNVEAIVSTRNHPSNAVRLGSVVALRRLASPAVAAFLEDEDPLVALEGARAIHDDFGIPEAMPALADLLNTTPHADNEALMRRVLNANLRLRDIERAGAVLAFAADDAHPEVLQLEALDILYTWEQPPLLDRVERRARRLPETDPAEIQALIQHGLGRLLNSSKPDVVNHAFQLARHYGIDFAPADLQQRLADESRPAQERIEVLGMLANQSRYSGKAFQTAFDSGDEVLRIGALEMLAGLDENVALRQIEQVLEKGESQLERQRAFAVLGDLHGREAGRLMERWVMRLLADEVAPEERLDVYLAAQARGGFEDKLTELQDRGAPQAYALYGGDPDRGQALFLQHPAAQCIRCHALDEGGSNVGPNLRGVGQRRDRAYLLESLLEPSKTLVEGFETPNGVSVMPPMGDILSPEELRDVIAFLGQL